VTIQEIALDLLQYAGVYGFTLPPNSDALPAEDETEVVRAITAMNAAMEILFRDGPVAIKYASRSVYLNPPTQITLNLTQGSPTATTTGFVAWMRGCSLQIAGDSMINRFQDAVYQSSIGSWAITLLRAYTGSSGGQLATVYADSALLDADVSAVQEPVEIPPDIRLRPSTSKSDFLTSLFFTHRYWPPRYMTQYVSFFTLWEKTFGVPQTYRVEQQLDSARVGGSLYISLNPIPTGAAMNLTFDVMRKPVIIDRSGLAEDGGNDPGLQLTQIPAEMVESYYMPIARWYYVSTHPSLKNRETRGTLKAHYDEALLRLRSGQALTPQVNPVHVRYL
jgi:hypothetical protein